MAGESSGRADSDPRAVAALFLRAKHVVSGRKPAITLGDAMAFWDLADLWREVSGSPTPARKRGLRNPRRR